MTSEKQVTFSCRLLLLCVCGIRRANEYYYFVRQFWPKKQRPEWSTAKAASAAANLPTKGCQHSQQVLHIKSHLRSGDRGARRDLRLFFCALTARRTLRTEIRGDLRERERERERENDLSERRAAL